jgi:hypothetical protein
MCWRLDAVDKGVELEIWGMEPPRYSQKDNGTAGWIPLHNKSLCFRDLCFKYPICIASVMNARQCGPYKAWRQNTLLLEASITYWAE